MQNITCTPHVLSFENLYFNSTSYNISIKNEQNRIYFQLRFFVEHQLIWQPNKKYEWS